MATSPSGDSYMSKLCDGLDEWDTQDTVDVAAADILGEEGTEIADIATLRANYERMNWGRRRRAPSEPGDLPPVAPATSALLPAPGDALSLRAAIAAGAMGGFVIGGVAAFLLW